MAGCFCLGMGLGGRVLKICPKILFPISVPIAILVEIMLR
jgi:hypothetical protein